MAEDGLVKFDRKSVNMGDEAFVFGSIFIMANRLQILGDELDGKLTTKEWLFMGVLLKEETAPGLTELSYKLGYSRQNTKRIASSLQKKGFIEIEKDENDSRISRLKVKKESFSFFKNREKIEENFILDLYRGIDKEAIVELRNGLLKMQRNMLDMEKKR